MADSTKPVHAPECRLAKWATLPTFGIAEPSCNCGAVKPVAEPTDEEMTELFRAESAKLQKTGEPIPVKETGPKAIWNNFLLRFAWRHKQLGCARHIGTSNMGEAMWNCHVHNRPAL